MGGKVIDMKGWVCGDLRVQRQVDRPAGKKDHMAWWLCICQACGKEHVVRGDALREGLTKSCGCRTQYWAAKWREKHARTNRRSC